MAGTQVVVGMEEDVEAAGGAAAARAGSGLATAARVRYVTRSIEALRPGQWLLARDQHDPAGPVRACRIGRTYVRTAYHLRVLTIRDGEGREQTVRVTDEHPFHVAWRGWTRARELSAGDRLLGPGGEASTVLGNLGEAHPEGVTVYNLEVEDDHTYFVRGEGSDGEPVWVHNACRYDAATKRWVDEAGNPTSTIAKEADVTAIAQELAARYPNRNIEVGPTVGGLECDILMDGVFIEVGANKSVPRMLEQLSARQALFPDRVGVGIWSGPTGHTKSASLNRNSGFIGLHIDDLGALLDAMH